jgi:parallel beta-helix repeat protein
MIGRNGIHTDFTYGLTVSHCYVGYSHVYSAGQGYGIALYNNTSGCLIENTIFEHLHAGVDMSYSASGNVIINNCFLMGYSDSGQAPGIAMHAVHSLMNLFEGNWSQEKFTSDITHGSSSHQTIFRNRINGHGYGGGNAPIIYQQYSRYLNAVGNILGETGATTVYDKATSGAQVNCNSGSTPLFDIGCGYSPEDSIAVSQVFRAVNAGFTNASGAATMFLGGFTTNDLVNSYFHTSKPGYFGSLNWPAYDPSRTTLAAIDKTNNPAGYRYVFGVDPPSTGGNKPAPPSNLRTIGP